MFIRINPRCSSSKGGFSRSSSVPKIRPWRGFLLGFYLRVLNAMLRGLLKVNQGRFHVYKDLIEESEVPERYRFDLEAWGSPIVVEEPPEDLSEFIERGRGKI